MRLRRHALDIPDGRLLASNWVWEHSVSVGAKRHWILDDNINGFYRMNRNQKIRVISPAIFRASEDFVERYTNIAMAGFQYEFFAWRRAAYPVFLLNTRVYSCILLKNDIVHRWRGRYNEDTDLSLRIMKDGMCTVLFYAFLCKKLSTMTCAGGNTEELYSGDGRLKMAESLQAQHPDVCRIIHKYGGRWQHEVDYSSFEKNVPVLKSGVIIPSGVNEYGMEIVQSPEYDRR